MEYKKATQLYYDICVHYVTRNACQDCPFWKLKSKVPRLIQKEECDAIFRAHTSAVERILDKWELENSEYGGLLMEDFMKGVE